MLPEDQEAFDSFIHSEVVPLMSRFDGAQWVRVMRAQEADDGAPPIYMTFETAYPSQEVMLNAFSKPIRAELRAKLAEIMPLFHGRIFHITQTLMA